MDTGGAGELPGYRLDECLRADEQVSVHRGERLVDQQPVIVKLAAAHASAQTIARLDREYDLALVLENLDVTQPVSFETRSGGYALVFLDKGYITLTRYLMEHELQLDTFYEIAVQLASVLGQVHARDVVHKDIKPDSIVINPDTLHLRLTDFGIAAHLPREMASNVAPVELEGSLPYIAPEQTGRMNRSVDGRSDFYALGVTFYEMLTGVQPFTSDDPAELVYQHIAQVPQAPDAIQPSIPRPLAQLILKLMAKEPEDRYQSAFGLMRDLSALRKILASGESSESFRIAQQDVPDRLVLPERLYGRDDILQALVESVNAVAGGGARMLTVAGRSGIGKSAVVREVMRPVAGRQGHFISGKFDQLNRDRPYSAIVQALEELVPKLLTESRTALERWRNSLLDAMGGNARVILDLIPGFELLVGAHPPVVELGPSESQHRFNLTFRRFLRALATDEQPLVIFLDDLQWADSASLSLLQVLVSHQDMTNLLLVGAYRDNEVGAGHPLLMLFSHLDGEGIPRQNISLDQLDEPSVRELVADSIGLSADEALSLSTLIFEKTRGNPFFVRQFMRTLSDRGLLVFDTSTLRWRWDVDSIRDLEITDNVVDLIAARINRLTPQAQHLVQLSACIGNQFDLQTLSVVAGSKENETARGLAEALREEIITPVGEGYKYAQAKVAPSSHLGAILYRFPHDRLHQAGYSTIPDEDRPALHERIGRLILAQSDENQVAERIFEIVNHLNLASREQADRSQKIELARLNLQAGQKAKSSTAHDAALIYFVAGTELLGEQAWSTHHTLAFELHLQKLDATYLSGQFEEAEVLSHRLLARAANTLEELRIRELIILSHTSRLQYRKAILASVQALALLDEPMPESPNSVQLALELMRTRLALVGKSPRQLAALPDMSDPGKLAAMRILQLASAPAYFDDPNLMPYLALRMVRLSVKYGNAPYSAYGYVLYAGVLCGVLNDVRQGLAMGELALQLVERFNAQDIKGRVLMVFGSFVEHWSRSIASSLPSYLEGANVCLDTGDLEFHGYNRYSHLSYAYMSGMSLDQIWDLNTQHYAAVEEHKHEKTQFIMRMMRESLRELRGPELAPRAEEEPDFDEKALVELWTEQDKQALAYYHKYRLVTRYMVRDYQACLESAQVITDNLHTVVGMAFSAYYVYFEALALTGTIPSLSGLARIRALARVRRIQKRFRTWSDNAPGNYRHKYLLVSAELQRVRGHLKEAEQAYGEAAGFAREAQSLHDEALAYELLGEFHLAQDRQLVARTYLREARKTYRRWGGLGWVAQLEQRHSGLLGGNALDPVSGMTGSESDGFGNDIDVATITRAARAISEKIVLDDVLHAVLRAAIVNAGATHGRLLLAQGDDLVIKAEAASDTDQVTLHSTPVTGSDKVPVSVINYVARSRESIVLDDASLDPTFSADSYISHNKTRSIICTPLVDKGTLIGFLYLENPLAHGAFTPARIQILEMLAAQAAISLENARLYREVSDHADALEVKVKERTEELEDAYSMLRDIFGKYVPQRVAEQLVTGRGSLQPTNTMATILYSDIEGFTSIAESMPPEQVVAMLNEYFPTVIEPIERHGGVVNQFQGDAMLVTFNVPVADTDHADNAVKTAIEIQRATAGRKFGGVPLRTRIGINTGEVFAGNVGSGERVNYTVHGDAVNLAARIEQLNKEHDTLVLVSGNTVELLRGDYPFRAVGEVDIRGKTAPVTLFEVDTDGQPSAGGSLPEMQAKAIDGALLDTLAARFRTLWLRCTSRDNDPEPIWDELLRRYSEPHRFYHTLGHLAQCLGELDTAAPHIREPDTTEMALWFHDIVYTQGSPENEIASARLFRRMTASALPETFVNRVCEFILATTHMEQNDDKGVAFMLDLDLSGFGLPWERYLADSQSVRQEAQGISDQAFYRNKLTFLEHMLQRRNFFQTDYFRQRLGDRAKSNIERYSALLRAQGFGD